MILNLGKISLDQSIQKSMPLVGNSQPKKNCNRPR